MVNLGMDKFVLILFLMIVMTLSATDLMNDFKNQAGDFHLLGEAFVLCLSILVFLRVATKAIKFKRENTELGRELKQSQEEALHWKKENEETLKGFSLAIQDQFETWKLSKAEKDVGLLLLKGFSLKEIAEFRNVSERTVRQQCIEIYRKSNLAGRAEFSAFFLEDLIFPDSQKT